MPSFARTSRCARGRHASPDSALSVPDQRQIGEIPPHPGRRMGLRAALPQRRRTFATNSASGCTPIITTAATPHSAANHPPRGYLTPRVSTASRARRNAVATPVERGLAGPAHVPVTTAPVVASEPADKDSNKTSQVEEVDLPGIEPVSGCWSVSRTGTELRNDIDCDSPELTCMDTECAHIVPSQPRG